MATTASLFAPTGLSLRGRVIDRRIGKGRRPHSIMAQQEQQQLEQEEEKQQQEQQGTLPEQQRQQQQQPKGQPQMQSLPRQPMAKSKNMSREYGGQWLSSVTRHVRIYAAYIDPITHVFDQTQMDKLTLILDPSNEFVWTNETCQKVYAYFQELVDHYEGAPLSEYTLRLIGSDIEHYIRKLLYDGEIKYNMNARVLNFSMGKPRMKFNSSQIQNVK
ncbi:NAD(P)H-quinone oxidoreductase subunit M, chloroplastic [Phoenix dactylifera]|uniref:NAD(P)H-quinone oxidoreductase subunit M, chloroplastic n=1 Tax=Phoenix dactylifera TaxID=42345 RepID=A0A8B7C4K0_PHODC|nr:NAD(P)H-quinone oxidoreductase subunit M, chloroplastic [Phoenix dactylifera]